MFRAGALILLAAALAASAPLPVPKPANGGQPQAAEQSHTDPKGQAAVDHSNAKPIPGASSRAPLYVKADCEHGCGYPERDQGWWQRLETDPVATFTAVLAILTFFLSFGTIRAANAAKAAVDGLPTVERAYIYPELVQTDLLATYIEEISKGYAGRSAPGPDDPVEKEIRVAFRLRNVGKTPGVVGPTMIRIGFGGTDRECFAIINDTATALGSQHTTDRIEFAIKFSLTQKEAIPITEGQNGVTVSGKFGFSDIWGDDYSSAFVYALDYDTGRLVISKVTDQKVEKKRSK